MLFELARHYSPCTIFLDECDSIMSHRGSSGSSANDEHEGSRRLKTELLVQMDGLLSNNSNVFILAASNLPWDLDPAFLRRMEKRILIPLPSKECRKEMIRSHLSEFSTVFRKDSVLNKASTLLEGYSGSDIKVRQIVLLGLPRLISSFVLTVSCTVFISYTKSLCVRRPRCYPLEGYCNMHR